MITKFLNSTTAYVVSTILALAAGFILGRHHPVPGVALFVLGAVIRFGHYIPAFR